MNEKGTSAIVYDNVLCAGVKNKLLNDSSDREIIDHEVEMIRSMPNKIGVALISYNYPHIQTQQMHETLTKFVARKHPPFSVLKPLFNGIARYCAILYADGIFHCDLFTNNVMLFYRTPTGLPNRFFIDCGISYNYRKPSSVVLIKGAPRTPDVEDHEYDFLFFMYSCLHCCSYLLEELMAHYDQLMVRMKVCFEKYHNNGRNHQWYLVGTLYIRLCWKIGLSES